jgi:hypothetical protein
MIRRLARLAFTVALQIFVYYYLDWQLSYRARPPPNSVQLYSCIRESLRDMLNRFRRQRWS